MARPRNDEDLKRNRTVTARFTKPEYDKIEEAAKQSEKAVAKYVHDQAVSGRIEIRYRVMPRSEDIKPVLAQMGKIGSNLNQIARYLNEGGSPGDGLKKDIRSCIDGLHETRKKLAELWEF